MRFIAVLAGALLLASAAPATVSASGPLSGAFMTRDLVQVLSSTCTWEEFVPPADVTCVNKEVLYYRESWPSERNDAPWVLLMLESTWVAHPDGTGEDVGFEYGFVLNPQGSFDERTMSSAAVSGTVPMSDGRDVSIDLVWDMSGTPIQVSGNNGLYNGFNDIDPHFADRCLTENHLLHMRYRNGPPGFATGWIGDTNMRDLFVPDNNPIIAVNMLWHTVIVVHGGCATG